VTFRCPLGLISILPSWLPGSLRFQCRRWPLVLKPQLLGLGDRTPHTASAATGASVAFPVQAASLDEMA